MSSGRCCSVHRTKLRVSCVPGHALHRQTAVLQVFQQDKHQILSTRSSIHCLSTADTDRETESQARNSPVEDIASSRESQETAYRFARLAGMTAVLSTSLLLMAHSADAAEALPLDVFAAFLVRA